MRTVSRSLRARTLRSLTRGPLGLSRRAASSFMTSYEAHKAERAAQGIVPLPLDATQTASLIEEMKTSQDPKLLALLEHRVPPGVDEAAYVKADYLAALAKGTETNALISKKKAVELLGTMQGGYNIAPLIDALEDAEVAETACTALKHTILVFDAFHDVKAKMDAGNEYAKKVIESWAAAEWFTSKPEVKKKLTFTVFKVAGETNTDDLSPAPDAWSRPDIPLHALAMLKFDRADGFFTGQEDGCKDVIEKYIAQGKGAGEGGSDIPLAYVGDVVGTGSSRKSATNSILWYMGVDIPNVPNKRTGGICIGSKIAPIFFNTMEDSGSFPIEMDVSKMEMGDVIDVYPYEGVTKKGGTDEEICKFALKTNVLFDEVRAGGRIPLIIGRGNTARACEALGLPATDVFRSTGDPKELPKGGGYTLAQKMVGKACGRLGVLPGDYCEPRMTTVGSQDTTGPMTKDELKDLACLGFSADLVMQSFCHTAAYPKPVDVKTHATLPDFIMTRGGVSLRPGDGIIHSWLNRMLLPDTVGTGGDSHTRFPIGISFPAGSGLVAFAAAAGIMPLDMPESVLVKFTGKDLQPGITLRDLVHAIPLWAKKADLLTIPKQDKVNVFSGKVLEIEGEIIDGLKCEQVFELYHDEIPHATAVLVETFVPGSLVSTHLAKLMMYERTYDPLEWHISFGAHLCLSPVPFIGCSQAHMSSPKGRCFTFDVGGDGVIDICLANGKKRGNDGLPRTVGFAIRTSVHHADNEEGSLDALLDVSEELNEGLLTLTDHQAYMRRREENHQHTLASTRTRVFYWTIEIGRASCRERV